MYTAIDIAGETFGLLTAVKRSETADPSGQARWFCVCDCGEEITALSYNLRYGRTTSCGCAQVAATRKANTKHGGKGTRAYKTWCSMRERCRDESNPNYGGRGIVVCPEWDNSFAQFLSDMGPPPDGMSLERKDNAGPYSATNCKWATPVEQGLNRRTNRVVTVKGVAKTMREWSNQLGVNYWTLHARWRRGAWPLEA